MMHSNKFVSSIKVNGKVMREHKDTIYLPFGSDFSIFLKNLNSRKAQVKISIDGDDILDGHALLVDPHSDLELKRWMISGSDSKGPKLKFVEKTDEIREIRDERSMDGIVEITYQYEKHTNPFLDYYKNKPTIRTWDENNPYNAPYGPIFGSQTGIDGGVLNCSVPSYVSQVESPQNDDGLTIMGEDIKQQFQEGYIGALDSEVNVMCFNLKGDINQEKIKKPITVKTLKECFKCSKTNAWDANFCSVCGSNIK